LAKGCLISRGGRNWRRDQRSRAHHSDEQRRFAAEPARQSAATRAHALSHLAAGNTFTTAELYPRLLDALGVTVDRYTLASLRYDLSKFRAKGLVDKLPNSRRYRLLPNGYSICLVFLKLFERVYAPLTAGLLSPLKADAKLPNQRRSQLDRLCQRVADDIDILVRAVGLKAA
jgi:hypothetical protein